MLSFAVTKHMENHNGVKVTAEKAKNGLKAVTKMFRKHLLLSNVAISVSLSGLGDYMQQKYENRKLQTSPTALSVSSRSWCPRRTAQMSLSFGLTSGVLCHYWYNYLDRFFPGKGIKIVIKKIITDQVLFSPICIVSCLLVACAFNNRDKESTYKEVVYKGQQLYIAEWLLWPPAQFINFYFLPTHYRVLYDNAVSLVYDIYTSYVQNQTFEE